VVEGVIAREARAALKDAEQAAAHDAVLAAEHDSVAAAEHDAERAVSPPRLERTDPTGVEGGVPTGRQAVPPRKAGNEERRGLARQNQAASTLAGRGYRVHQRPSGKEIAAARRATGDTGRAAAKPDYLVEDRVFDCYSPGPTISAQNIGSNVEDKVTAGQTQRVVLNIADWPGSLSELTAEFGRLPEAGLRELIVIQQDGTIIHLFAE
jgi:hypothetical protein